jgi:NAD+ kinase
VLYTVAIRKVVAMNNQSPNIESVFVEFDDRDTRNQQAYETLAVSLARVGIEQTVQIADAQAMVVIGGDGTLIHAVHKHDFPQLPIRGVNTGTIGFFMSTEPTNQEIDELAANLTGGNYRVDPLSVIQITDDRNRLLGRALNEVVMKSGSGQAMHMKLQIGDADFGKLTGDGVIMSTPSGSTAYAKSAGGSFIHESLRVYEVVPLTPYYSPLDRPAIVPGDVQSKMTVFDTQKRPFQISLDGKIITLDDVAQNAALNDQEQGFSFIISPDTTVNMIRFDGHEYFKKLGKKIREIRETHS